MTDPDTDRDDDPPVGDDRPSDRDDRPPGGGDGRQRADRSGSANDAASPRADGGRSVRDGERPVDDDTPRGGDDATRDRTGGSPDRTDDAPTRDDDAPDDAPDDADPEALAARIELLAEENRRLRNEYARARRARYRRTAVGLAAVGLAAALAGALFPAGRDVLFVLGATGVFGGLLTYYLSPGQFVAADVGERVYAALAANHAALVDELGLREGRRYLPGGDGRGPQLFVPQRADAEPPSGRSGPVLTDEGERGLLLEPTGAALYDAYERAVTGEPAAAPAPLAAQLADAIVEQFELVRSADPDVDAGDGRVTVAIVESAFGDVDRFDHPVASFLAVGLAAGLDRPVDLSVDPGGDRADWLVTCRWDAPAEPERASE